MKNDDNVCLGILALGNLMRTDDAVGMLALRVLEEDPRLPRGVRLIAGGTLGLDLLGRLDGLTHVVALDAVEMRAEPGSVSCFAGEQLLHLPVSKSVHLLGFSDLLGAMKLLEAPPVEIVLIGVQPESTGWGTELTQAVAGAMPLLVEMTLRQLSIWDISASSETV